MHRKQDTEPAGADILYKSKSQKKREDRALQRLGERLVALPPGQLGNVDLPEEIREAVAFARTVKSHSARRREILHIGALLRQIDPHPIESALREMTND